MTMSGNPPVTGPAAGNPPVAGDPPVAAPPSPPPPPTAAGTAEQQTAIIGLLMREYDALRSEITQRIGARTQIAGFAGVISAVVAGNGGLTFNRPNLYIALVIVAFSLVWWRDSNQGILRLGRHLRMIEEQVNTLSTQLYGRPALSWEDRRQAERRAERTVWRLIGRMGGWNPR
ncbi:hypothetical protein [Streptomyces chattanoogensis]|uniref:hypothetical protein n=1 Tax=Streptomyces chattanoogensis TaxID=66876 RepID=UPI0006B43B12|nr:hypothetical protein [Streptomyces chattanoogensis]